MKSFLLLFLLLAASLHAQQPVRYSLTEAAGKIPLPPATLEDAASLVTNESGLQLGPVLEALNAELIRTMTAISTPPSMAELQDPALAAKMENMTDAEKMQFAMQLQAKMVAAQTTRARPGTITPADTALIKRFEAAQQEQGHRRQDTAHLPLIRQQHDAERMQKLEEAHAKIDQDAEAGRGKLGHDGDTIDPARLRAYEQGTWSKHLAIENSFLAERRAEWTTFRDTRLKALAAIDADLHAAKYGTDANSYLLSILSQYQLLGIEELQDLLQTAQQDVLHAAEWQQRWKDWQEQNK